MKWLLIYLASSYMNWFLASCEAPVCVNLSNGPKNRSKEIIKCNLPKESIKLQLECKIIFNYHTRPSDSYTGIEASFDVYNEKGNFNATHAIYKYDTLKGHSSHNESLFFEHETNLDVHLRKNISVDFSFNNKTKIASSKLIIYNLMEVFDNF